MKDFKDLRVWQKSHALTLAIYRVTQRFPKEEMYGLTSQIRRAAVSAAANIAEGCGRRSDREFRRFLQIARGSASELEYHLLLARDLRFPSAQEYTSVQAAVAEVQRMLTALVKSLTPQATEIETPS
ncbi:MAG TPA: four helix bundle protein [Bryobacteraceae bacterium]|nr:four helix bundle protein [Bryobacteraceae bacterium]